MEEHLNDKNRLGKEWKELEEYEADQNSTYIGSLPAYMTKNRYSNILPCRAKLNFVIFYFRKLNFLYSIHR